MVKIHMLINFLMCNIIKKYMKWEDILNEKESFISREQLKQGADQLEKDRSRKRERVKEAAHENR